MRSAPPRLFAQGKGLDGPSGIAFDRGGGLWVVNDGDGSIVGYDRRGKLIKRIVPFLPPAGR